MLVRVLMSWRSFRVLIDFCRVFAEKPVCPCPGFLRKILKSDPGILVWPGIRVWLRSMADARKIPADLIEQGGKPDQARRGLMVLLVAPVAAANKLRLGGCRQEAADCGFLD
jgi:hypothetical protein